MHRQPKGHNKGPSYEQKAEAVKYCRAVKQFLESYKTKKCELGYEHREELCQNYHTQQDMRRNPYKQHRFKYFPYQYCQCIWDQNGTNYEICPNFHNGYEENFHPLIYKSKQCPRFFDCPYKFQCYGIHQQDQNHFSLGEYFRFDIDTFKTQPCLRKEPHQKKVCLYYHDDRDMRRPYFQGYNHILCERSHCKCSKSHNKIEQLYHPSRFKTKFCQTYRNDPMKCAYRDFCSFAHTQAQIIIELYDQKNKDPNYITMYYKTIWCPYTEDHDRGECSYAHNFQDYRRSPKDYKYIAEKCQSWNFKQKIQSIQEGGCQYGMNCNKCHGWMEQKYHPQLRQITSNKPQLTSKKPLSSNKHKPKQAQVQQSAINNKLNLFKKLAENNIESIAYNKIQSSKPIKNEPKAAKFAPGAPFFKSDRCSSESKQTKAKSGNYCSDRSCNEDQPRNKDQISTQFEKKRISSVYLEDKMWQFNEQMDTIKNSGRSKSQNNSSQFIPSYSHTIKDALQSQNGLIEKLARQKIHQVHLENPDYQQKISRMSFLNPGEKKKLVQKLRQYSLKREIGEVKYSHRLTLFFVQKNADGILEKLRAKRVKQPKVLQLISRQSVKDFQFLSEKEKELLPRVVKLYKGQLQYGSLIRSVEKFIDEPGQETDFNNDK